jgi:hypothetical protein
MFSFNCGLLMFTVFVTRFILYFDSLEDKQIENMLISDLIKPLDNCGLLMFTVFVTRFILYFDIQILYTLESHNCQVV